MDFRSLDISVSLMIADSILSNFVSSFDQGAAIHQQIVQTIVDLVDLLAKLIKGRGRAGHGVGTPKRYLDTIGLVRLGRESKENVDSPPGEPYFNFPVTIGVPIP